MLAAMLNRHQQRVIEYLKAENQVLRAQIGTKRVQLTDIERRRLAVHGKAIGRKTLSEICSIVTPAIRDLVIRMATQNRHWGYERIEAELRRVGRDSQVRSVGFDRLFCFDMLRVRRPPALLGTRSAMALAL